jgi:NTP pyrophosphatase (non-canonical NTP hydrolase)
MGYPSYDLTIEQARERSLRNSQAWFPEIHEEGPEYFLIHSALGLAGECGEAVDIIKKWHRDPKASIGAIDKTKLGAELVDVLIYLLHVASATGVDLEAAYNRKVNANEKRFGRG